MEIFLAILISRRGVYVVLLLAVLAVLCVLWHVWPKIVDFFTDTDGDDGDLGCTP